MNDNYADTQKEPSDPVPPDPSLTKMARIRQLNDQLRTTGRGGRILVTQAVSQLGRRFLSKAVEAMRNVDAFCADNDPYQEHDFGSFSVGGETLYFKIDYYAPSMDAGSEDPADPVRCTRVLTLMLASDY